MQTRDVSIIKDYHAHVYYDAESKPIAAELREALDRNFDVNLGRWHDRPVGPHPSWSYQVAFSAELFGTIIPWFAINRETLVIFIHPNTGDAVEDHEHHAIWMGEKRELDIDSLR